jgi:hypothetical protein
MTSRTIDLNLELETKKTNVGAQTTVKSLKDIETQANRTREKMEKLANVGTKLALLGGAITAPFILAMKKYVDTAGETESTSKKLVELGKKWEDSQVRIGRVTAEIVLPALEQALDIVDKVADFAEKNPGMVKAALGIGGTLVVVGGLLTMTAQIVSTLATIQGLAAGSGIALGGGTAAAGGAASAGALAALAPAIVAAFAAWAGANLGLIIANGLTGQSYTMTDLANTAKLVLALNAKGLDQIIGWFGGKTSFFESVSTALGISVDEQARINKTITDNQTAAINAQAAQNTSAQIGASNEGFSGIINAIASWFRGGKASGGYMEHMGLYAGAERGREFVLNASATRTAEQLIGGRLTQQRLLTSVVQNYQMSNGMTIIQARRLVAANKRDVLNTFASAFGA